MVSSRNYDLRKGPLSEHVQLRLLALVPLTLVLSIINLVVYGAFQLVWQVLPAGPDLSFLTYVLPAAGEVYVFHDACGYPDLAFLYASFVVFNLFGVVALDMTLLRLGAHLVPIYKTVRRPILAPHGRTGRIIFPLLFLFGLTMYDYISPFSCAGIDAPMLPLMVGHAMATAWLAMGLQSGPPANKS